MLPNIQTLFRIAGTHPKTLVYILFSVEFSVLKLSHCAFQWIPVWYLGIFLLLYSSFLGFQFALVSVMLQLKIFSCVLCAPDFSISSCLWSSPLTLCISTLWNYFSGTIIPLTFFFNLWKNILAWFPFPPWQNFPSECSLFLIWFAFVLITYM